MIQPLLLLLQLLLLQRCQGLLLLLLPLRQLLVLQVAVLRGSPQIAQGRPQRSSQLACGPMLLCHGVPWRHAAALWRQLPADVDWLLLLLLHHCHCRRQLCHGGPWHHAAAPWARYAPCRTWSRQ
jgi:hypothetical protein